MKKALIKGAINFGIGTGLSRILGFVREMAFAYLFGAGWQMDAFRVAFRIPNLLRDIIAEGTLTPAFIPVFAEKYKEKDGAREFVRNMWSAMLIITGGLVIIGMIFAPLWVKFIAMGFTGEKLALTIKMTRIMFPSIIFVSSSALVMGILNFFQHFFVSGMSSCWANLAIIGIAFALAHKFGVSALVIGALVGSTFQLLSQIPTLTKEKYPLLPKFQFTPDIKRVFISMIPIAIGYSALKINTVINTIIASFFQNGVIAWLEYAFRLMYVPVGIIGVAIANATLPFASRAATEKNQKEFSKILLNSVVYGTVLGAIATYLSWQFATPICRIIYQHGRFTPDDTIQTAIALRAYSIGIPGLILTQILATTFYSMKKTRIPMYIGFATVVINVICVLTLTKVVEPGYSGIPLAISISNLANAIVLGVVLWYKLKHGLFPTTPQPDNK